MPISSTGHFSASGFCCVSGGNRGSEFGIVMGRGLVNCGVGTRCPGLSLNRTGHNVSVCRLPISAWTSTELDWQWSFFPAANSPVAGCSLLLFGLRTFAKSKSPIAWLEVKELLRKRLKSDWARGRAMVVVKVENNGSEKIHFRLLQISRAVRRYVNYSKSLNRTTNGQLTAGYLCSFPQLVKALGKVFWTARVVS